MSNSKERALKRHGHAIPHSPKHTGQPMHVTRKLDQWNAEYSGLLLARHALLIVAIGVWVWKGFPAFLAVSALWWMAGQLMPRPTDELDKATGRKP